MKGFSKIVLLAATALLAACGDSTVAPRSVASDVTIPGGGATAALGGLDTIRFSFTIDPSRNTFYWLGLGNSIVFPAGSLCDPANSTYGPDQWDQPCPIATHAVVINAKAWLDHANHPRIDFEQHVRFAPSNDPAKWVVLTLTDYRGAVKPQSNIGYCPSPTSDCINEAAADPSVATYKDPVTGHLTRRIKHFSGYNVFAGRGGDGSDASSWNFTPSDGTMHLNAERVDGDGESPGQGRGNGRQGYMLAWGRSDRDQ
ncbi:MAG TPA: hypothetical protein VH277_12015 [Gemmatimonadaceae bacterium]|jgi:hypothetical protein|nr:hypothetical protein [Gemmatimonadaceae bacterium]